MIASLAESEIDAILHQFLLCSDEGSKSFCQQVGVERLLERFVDAASIEAHRLSVIGQQCDQNHICEVGILSQVLADLNGFDLTDREVDNDAIGSETFGLNAGFETALPQQRL